MTGAAVASGSPVDRGGRWLPSRAGPRPSRLRHAAFLALVALVAITLSACAAGVNPQVGSGAGGAPAGFWLGLWHGVIAPITFVVSLFSDEVSLYEVHNSGNWYDLGFVLGFGVLLGGGRAGRRPRG